MLVNRNIKKNSFLALVYRYILYRRWVYQTKIRCLKISKVWYVYSTIFLCRIGKSSGYKSAELASLKEDETLPIGGKEIQVRLTYEGWFKITRNSFTVATHFITYKRNIYHYKEESFGFTVNIISNSITKCDLHMNKK